MSKALTKAQADLDALRVELETWIAVQTVLQSEPVQRTPKPAVKRTRAELVASATSPVQPVTSTASPVQQDEDADTDTAWLDLLSDSVPETVVTAPLPVVPVTPEPLYVDATALVSIDLEPAYVPRTTAPLRAPQERRTFRQAFMDGYRKD